MGCLVCPPLLQELRLAQTLVFCFRNLPVEKQSRAGGLNSASSSDEEAELRPDLDLRALVLRRLRSSLLEAATMRQVAVFLLMFLLLLEFRATGFPSTATSLLAATVLLGHLTKD